jgi:hypothetical protein
MTGSIVMTKSIGDYLDTINTSCLEDFDRSNFIKYCEYMFWRNGDPPNIVVRPYYRKLYKMVEMLIEEDLIYKIYTKPLVN